MEKELETILFIVAGVFLFCGGENRVSQYFKIFWGHYIKNKTFETLGCF